ncbi:hypothetical protein BH10BAC2_BH10BAC2_44380 [soil metagenome]
MQDLKYCVEPVLLCSNRKTEGPADANAVIFSSNFCIVRNKEKNPEECDATWLYSSSKAGYIRKIFTT